MKGFAIHLREDGLFEAKSCLPRDAGMRVGLSDPQGLAWAAYGKDELGVKWRAVAEFQSLDEALDYAASAAFGPRAVAYYDVLMRDGTRFTRPGRVPIEQAMAAAGWSWVSSFMGFLMVALPCGSSVFEARTAVTRALAGTEASLGEVNPCDEEGGRVLWCADVSVEHGGFVRVERLEAEAAAAFAAEGLRAGPGEDGIEFIPAFDFQGRTAVARAPAAVIPFPVRGAGLTAA